MKFGILSFILLALPFSIMFVSLLTFQHYYPPELGVVYFN